MKNYPLAFIALLAFALPAFAQESNQEMFLALERLDRLETAMAVVKQGVIETKADVASIKADMAAFKNDIKADMSTLKMNNNNYGANIDALNAKVEKLQRAPANAAASAWTEAMAPADSSWAASSWSAGPTQMMRFRLFRRLSAGRMSMAGARGAGG